MNEAGAVNHAPHSRIHHFLRIYVTMRSRMACAMHSNLTKVTKNLDTRGGSRKRPILVEIYRLLLQNRIGGPWLVEQVGGAGASSAG